MRRSDAEGPVGRAIGSVMHVGLQGQEGMHVELQSQMVAAHVNFFSGAAGPVGRAMGSAMHVGLQGQEGMHVELQSQMVAAEVDFFRVLKAQWAGRWALHCMWDCRDRKVYM